MNYEKNDPNHRADTGRAAASTAFVFSSGQNTVISLSYLSGTFASQLTDTLRSSLDALDEVYAAAEDKLEEQTGQDLSGSGWTSTSSFRLSTPWPGRRSPWLPAPA